ncbi:MAG: ABC transporter permease [Burkholderiales bacterium]|nr:MAG: ABC transporter permease [Burkholderiales bacterium]
MNAAWAVFRKELSDALRDRRALTIALTMALLSGPVVFTLVSNLVSGIEERVSKREIVVVAQERAPTLVNFLQRAGASVLAAPADWSEQLRSGRLQNAVVLPPEDFEEKLARGETVAVDVAYDESHDRAQPLVSATLRTLQAFNRELGTQRLLARGVSPRVMAAIEVQERNLAAAQARGARLLFIVPWAALIVAIVGALAVAIDVSAGERERGSLEPLLMNPVPAWAIVLGKWAVVMLYSVAIVLLTLAGFLVSIRLIRSETLSALMQLGARELWLFLVLLLPFAALMAAVNMLAATFGRTHKEAQTYVSYIAMAAQFSAVVPIFLTVRDSVWQLLVPSVAQLAVLMKALRGEPLSALDLWLPTLVCIAGLAACLFAQARLLTRESIVFSRG